MPQDGDLLSGKLVRGQTRKVSAEPYPSLRAMWRPTDPTLPFPILGDRETIMRYGILSLALLFKDAREVDVWSREEAEKAGALNLTDLMEERLLTTREAALLEGMPAKSQMVSAGPRTP